MNKTLKIGQSLITGNEKCLLPIYYWTEQDVKTCSSETSVFIISVTVVCNILLLSMLKNKTSFIILIVYQIILLLIIPWLIYRMNNRQWKLYNNKELITSVYNIAFENVNTYINDTLIINPRMIIYLIFGIYIYFLLPKIKNIFNSSLT